MSVVLKDRKARMRTREMRVVLKEIIKELETCKKILLL